MSVTSAKGDLLVPGTGDPAALHRKVTASARVTTVPREKVVAKDNTTSNSSTTSEDGLVSNDYSSESTTVYDGEDTPYETKELLPEVEGVVVVAEGAGNAAVETEIYETVMALFEVDAHKISVGKMRLQEGT